MRKALIALLIIVALLLLLVVGAAFALESRWFSDYLSDKLSARYSREIAWDKGLQIDWSLHPDISVTGLRVENADWAPNDEMVRLQRATVQLGLPQLLSGTLALEDVELVQPTLHLARSSQHGANWAPFISKKKEDKEPLLQPRFGDIRIDSGKLTFRAPAKETDITVTLDTAAPGDSERTLRVEGAGQLRGHPMDLQLIGDPPRQLAAEFADSPAAKGRDDQPYALHGKLEWQNHLLRLDGRVDAPTSLKGLNVTATLRGPSADELLGLLGYSTRPAPYQIQGRLAHQGQRWSLTNLSGHLGESQFSGHGSYAVGGPRPRIEAALEWTHLDMDDTLPMLFKGTPQEPQEQEPQEQQPLVSEKQLERWLQPLQRWDANVELRVGEVEVRDLTFQEFVADVQLNNGTLELEPIRFGTTDGYVRLTGTVHAGQPTPEAKLDLQLGSVDIGKLLAPFGYSNLGTVDGEATLLMRNQALLLGESNLTYRQPSEELLVKADVQPQETEQDALGMRATLSGEVKGKTLDGSLTTGPLLDLDDPRASYPLDAELQLGETRLGAEGSITQPLKLKDLALDVRASGPDPAVLDQLVDASIPHLPPYEIRGHLVREDASWYLRNIDARMGDSDLSGDIRWDLSRPERPTVWANLHSEHLDVRNFSPGGEQQQAQESDSGSKEALPEASFLPKQLQVLDAQVQYDAQRLQAGPLPLDELSLDLRLEDGVLKLKPVTFGIGRGNVQLELGLDGTSAPVEGRAEIEVNRVNLKQVLQPLEIANQSKGIIGGRGQFWFNGNSVDEILASLDGELRLIMNDGTLDALLVEAAGLDLGEVLVTLFGEEPDPVDVKCAYTAMHASGGLVDVKPLLIATSDSNLVGRGDVNLGKEEFEIIIEAHPKDFSLLTLSSPVRVYGSFSNPKVDLVNQELLSQSILAAVGAAVFPPAALLGLAEVGDGDPRVGCRSLVASSELQVTAE